MKKLTLVILLLSVIVGVQAKQAKKKKKQAAKTGEIISVEMHRTVCYGKCPDYLININKDGTVTYTARMFTPDTGIFKKTIGKAKAAEVIALFKQYRVDTCMEMYENRLSDLPGLNMTINYKKSTKKVFNCDWGPIFLKEIAHAMEDVGKKPEDAGAEWKKVGMPVMK